MKSDAPLRVRPSHNWTEAIKNEPDCRFQEPSEDHHGEHGEHGEKKSGNTQFVMRFEVAQAF